MPATAVRPRQSVRGGTATAAPRDTDLGTDGHPAKRWRVYDPITRQEEERGFSLRPYAEEEKTTYWNPIFIGQTMLWRSQDINEWGIQPVIQRETWHDGRFAPRNDWERHMTEEYLRTLPGGNPEKWQGFNHPDNEAGTPPHSWRCQCGWPCGNWQAFNAHRKYHRHVEVLSE